MLALRGWRLDRSWALLGAGFLALTVADSIYLLHVADGSTDVQQRREPLLHGRRRVDRARGLAAAGAVGAAAHRRRHHAAGARSRSLLPAWRCWDTTISTGWTRCPFVLAMLTVLAALLRFRLAFRDLRSFNEARRQAVTDDLTELPNRRLFQRRLEEAIDRGAAPGTAWRC